MHYATIFVHIFLLIECVFFYNTLHTNAQWSGHALKTTITTITIHDVKAHRFDGN